MTWLYVIVGLCAFDAGFVAGAFWHALCRRNQEAEEAGRRMRRPMQRSRSDVFGNRCIDNHVIGINEFPPRDQEALREAINGL